MIIFQTISKYPIEKHTSDFLKQIPTKMDEVKKLNTAGSRRILIELESNPKKAEAYALKYNELVLDICSSLKSNSHNKHSKIDFKNNALEQANQNALESKFVHNFLKIIKLKLKSKVEDTTLLSTFIETGAYDCDIISTLIYDVALNSGMKANLVICRAIGLLTGGHVLVALSNNYFDPAKDDVITRDILSLRYGWYYTLSSAEVDAPAFFARGNSRQQSIFLRRRDISRQELLKLEEGVISDYTRAIELAPQNAPAYFLRGVCYVILNKYQRAIYDYTRAIKIDPKDKNMYEARASCYRDIGNIKAAEKDEKKYKELAKKYK